MNTLAETRLGRVLLHALCLFAHPGRRGWRWHWSGIRREMHSASR